MFQQITFQHTNIYQAKPVQNHFNKYHINKYELFGICTVVVTITFANKPTINIPIDSSIMGKYQKLPKVPTGRYIYKYSLLNMYNM